MFATSVLLNQKPMAVPQKFATAKQSKGSNVLTYSSRTSLPTPRYLANSSMPSSVHAVESTSIQTQSAARQIAFTSSSDAILSDYIQTGTFTLLHTNWFVHSLVQGEAFAVQNTKKLKPTIWVSNFQIPM